MNLTSNERIVVILALEARADKYAGYVHSFEGKEEYAEHYRESKLELEKTVDLIKKFEEVPF